MMDILVAKTFTNGS
jgi:hypothetical protein